MQIKCNRVRDLWHHIAVAHAPTSHEYITSYGQRRAALGTDALTLQHRVACVVIKVRIHYENRSLLRCGLILVT